MEPNSESPLRKYRRQPKIYINLPSKGQHSPAGTFFDNKTSEIAVFSMTANDEILFKTPDALINGEATANCMKSCVPTILNPWTVSTLDLDTILVSMRMASYGSTMNVTSLCPKCNAENAYDIPLQNILDYYQTLEFNDKCYHDNFCITVRPMNYREFTELQKKSVSLQRALNFTVPQLKDDEEKDKFTDSLVNEIAQMNIKVVFDAIVSVEADGHVETDKQEIKDWIEGNDIDVFNAIRNHINKNSQVWTTPRSNATCSKCEHSFKLNVNLDYSDFFGRG